MGWYICIDLSIWLINISWLHMKITWAEILLTKTRLSRNVLQFLNISCCLCCTRLRLLPQRYYLRFRLSRTAQIDGSTVKPSDSKEAEKWLNNGSKIITSMLDSINPIIATNLAQFSPAKEMWDFLKIFQQNNWSTNWLIHLKEQTFQEFYASMPSLWS